MRSQDEVKNQPVTVIHDYSHAGEGVGRFDGKPVFIPLAIRGENVHFEITEEKKNFFRGKLLEILEPAIGREAAHCPTSKTAVDASCSTCIMRNSFISNSSGSVLLCGALAG